MARLLLLATLVSSALLLCTCVDVTISNVIPRRDTAGQIMDAHDGNIFLKDGVYYYYAASYGDCQEPAGTSGCAGAAPGACGFRMDHNVSLFTSTDMHTWTSHGPVMQMAQSGITGILFCPKVLYNTATQLYVLWWNWIEGSNFALSYYAVATSPTPYGPFTTVVKNVTTLAYADTGDFSLMQDDDGTAYVIYTSHIVGSATTHVMSVEQLTDDYLSTRGAKYNSGFFGASFVEAPALFKRNGVYYAVFGQCCCYCGEGSPVYVHTAAHPLGPYTTQNNIGAHVDNVWGISRQAALMTAARGSPAALKAHADVVTIPAQQTDIYLYESDEGVQFAWYGDRWQSAPDRVKGHDFTYWSPLQFTADGNITAMVWHDSFTVNVKVQ
eukprot:TRINITY_DN11960_c0_g1_i1.p1 TRINITY_DN11960_c0_g1~~TRINITY_DN11960_c0_g1_i1.p1  ORF type:complete len:390 (-),score=94.49 TRINITY_DN11960_c0_g1_i1:847-1995(-)